MGMASFYPGPSTAATVIYAPVSLFDRVRDDIARTCNNIRISAALRAAERFIEKMKETNSRGALIWPGLDGMPAWFQRYQMPRARALVQQTVRRVQERFPIVQRSRRKRRRLIQSFAST